MLTYGQSVLTDEDYNYNIRDTVGYLDMYVVETKIPLLEIYIKFQIIESRMSVRVRWSCRQIYRHFVGTLVGTCLSMFSGISWAF